MSPIVLAMCLIGPLACSSSVDDGDRIPLTRDLRDYAREARANLAQLSPEQRATVEPALVAHEQAIAAFDRLSAKGQTRHAVHAPLLATGAFLAADDATGFGVADDVVIPFLAVGVLAVYLVTSGPAGSGALRDAYDKVHETGKRVREAMESSRIDDDGVAADVEVVDDGIIDHGEVTSAPGVRQHCIDRYVDCQANAPKSYNRNNCQPCMDRCLVNGYQWPRGDECDYSQRRRRRSRRGKSRF